VQLSAWMPLHPGMKVAPTALRNQIVDHKLCDDDDRGKEEINHEPRLAQQIVCGIKVTHQWADKARVEAL
jgi:hypothetical protein